MHDCVCICGDVSERVIDVVAAPRTFMSQLADVYIIAFSTSWVRRRVLRGTGVREHKCHDVSVVSCYLFLLQLLWGPCFSCPL